MSKQFHFTLPVETEEILGKPAGYLGNNLRIKDNVISGELRYLTGYTGFSGAEDEQSGYYVAVKCIEAISSEEEVTATLYGPGTQNVDKPVKLDEDGELIVRLHSNEQYVVFKGKIDEEDVETTLSYGGITFADKSIPQPEELIELGTCTYTTVAGSTLNNIASRFSNTVDEIKNTTGNEALKEIDANAILPVGTEVKITGTIKEKIVPVSDSFILG